MSQPPHGQPPDGRPTSGDGAARGGGWGRQTPQGWPGPGGGWGQPAGWGEPPPEPGHGWRPPAAPPAQGWGQQPGPPGPPPAQGSWAAPQWSPGYGEQPTRVGGFGIPAQQPPGPGPTGWGQPGGAGVPGGGRNRKRTAVIAGAAGLVVVVVVAVLLVVGLDGGDGRDSTAAGGPTGTTATASSPSPGTTPARPSSSGGFTSGPSAAADPADFLAQLPADFTDCAPGQLAGNGDVAAASCGAAVTQPGPAEATFSRYPDVGTLDTAFTDGVAAAGLPPLQGESDCSTTTGYGEWVTNGLTGGQVACQVTDDGHVLITWTDEEFLAEGFVRAPGTTQADVGALYDWWTANSFFQG